MISSLINRVRNLHVSQWAKITSMLLVLLLFTWCKLEAGANTSLSFLFNLRFSFIYSTSIRNFKKKPYFSFPLSVYTDEERSWGLDILGVSNFIDIKDFTQFILEW